MLVSEELPGALHTEQDLLSDLLDGVKFSSLPGVGVVKGDLPVSTSQIKLQNNHNQLVIPIKSASSTASTIKISGVKYTLDTTI